MLVARSSWLPRLSIWLVRKPVATLPRSRVLQFGGIDGVVNTAAIYPVPGARGRLTGQPVGEDASRERHRQLPPGQETDWIFKDQQLPAAMVLTGSANAVVPKKGSEAYDTSKSAVNHLIRELAIGLAPLVRVNGIAPATVVAGSTMFPRDRVIQSLQKYDIAFAESESTEDLRGSSPSSTRNGRSRGARFCRGTARTRLSGC